jgi:hypothetical protein
MDQNQAEFFKTNILPIIREAGKNREVNTEQTNPLRPMLRLLLVYIDYLEAQDTKKTEAQA